MTDFLTGPWEWSLLTAVNLTLAAVAYGWGLRRRRPVTAQDGRDLPPWPVVRTLAFAGALVLLAVSWMGPLAGWGHTFFWAHMTQHLIVMMVVAPLLVLSAPLQLAREAMSDTSWRRRVEPVLAGPVVRWATDPVVTWLLFATVLLGVHFSGFYEWALGNHDAEQFVERPLFLVAAVLYYLPLIGSNPYRGGRPRPSSCCPWAR